MPTPQTIRVLGGGPAGLYSATLIKRLYPASHVEVWEQNRPGVTFGFGVVFSAQALDGLGERDPELLSAMRPALETWEDIEVRIHGEAIRIDGIGFTAIGRLTLLDLLRRQAEAAGVNLIYREFDAEAATSGTPDMVVVADGVNSVVRTAHAAQFGTEVSYLTNRFAWFGASRPFDFLTQTFRRTDRGAFNAHHYRYQPDRSTFLVECDAETWAANGFNTLSEEQSARIAEEIFSEDLDGAKLIANKSVWRQFPQIWNRTWHHRNMVLLGDALRTAHYSIGSGTRLALEDARALADALRDKGGDVAGALRLYQERREPEVAKLVRAANASATWYEDFATHMDLPAWKFAASYISRSGRVDLERLTSVSPRFVEAYRRKTAPNSVN